jgi:hypothetical protein
MSSERNRKIIIQLVAGLGVAFVLLLLFRFLAFIISDILIFVGYGLILFFTAQYVKRVLKS